MPFVSICLNNYALERSELPYLKGSRGERMIIPALPYLAAVKRHGHGTVIFFACCC